MKLAAEAEAADRSVFAAAAAHNAKLQRDDEEHTRVGSGAVQMTCPGGDTHVRGAQRGVRELRP